MKNGVTMIRDERHRQQSAEGFTVQHDAAHTGGELAVVAALYAVAGHRPKIRVLRKGKDAWPWRAEDDKRGKHPYLKRLAIAGALIAAEIDRVQRHIHGDPESRRLERRIQKARSERESVSNVCKGCTEYPSRCNGVKLSDKVAADRCSQCHTPRMKK